MTTNARAVDNRTDAPTGRPRSFPLGTDGDGAHHVRLVPEQQVHVVTRDDVERYDVADGALDDWMDHVDERRGWADRRYGVSLAEQLGAALEAAD